MFKAIDTKKKYSEMEKEIVRFWKKNKIFEKSIENRSSSKRYNFYDGPPFATGLPHYGHIVGTVLKDVVPRYWTMQGYQVKRRWGWDCHGLPIENIIEKKLGSKTKKEIKKLGVDKFNELCRSKVLAYASEWEKIIPRLGRWVDMKNAYRTMDLKYMESVWWVFKQLWDKDLIYKDYRSMHICPRCETTLSQSEVSEGYKDVKDLSVTAKFELEKGQKLGKGKDKIKDNVYILAWTTTPWTLPGNVALAVGRDIKYTALRVKGGKELFIVANDRVKDVFKDKDIEIVHNDIVGKDLIGLRYKPLWNTYAKNKELENLKNGWKVYEADFVATEEGTGVVHIAPAFGEDDMNLGKEKKLPFVQHVGMDGVVEKKVEAVGGLNVKPIDDPQATDVEVIKYLAGKGLLFQKEKYEHSYPHCWRCDTPLINYATTSWFVAVTKIKKELLKNAEDINWSPEHIKKGRWGKWLEGARDWSISRQRFWASVMPIWECDKCGERKVFGSIKELEKKINLGSFYIMRHGEAESNVKRIYDTNIKSEKHLTAKGRIAVSETAKKLKGKNIDIIICSDFTRTKETAEIVKEEIGAKIIEDKRIREINVGDLDGQPYNMEIISRRRNGENLAYPNGENWTDIKTRVDDFYRDMSFKYRNKRILVISHGDTLLAMEASLADGNFLENIKKISVDGACIQEAELREVKHRIVDLHKHIVDKITFKCEKCEGTMKRIPDVLDTWFDSGSMPYGQEHYPFENKEEFENNFPADFIAEGVDQTRAWFYYLHIIAGGIFNQKAFKNVIVNGIVLAEDGKKMSKKLQNYPDPMKIVEKYGADPLRFYLMQSPIINAGNLNFNEKDLSEIAHGTFRMLWQSYSFFVMYANVDKWEPKQQQLVQNILATKENHNILDTWIISELHQLIKGVNERMKKYRLMQATRLIAPFVDNLSNWYIRRSRKRFWKSENDADKNEAYATLYYVLIETAKLMAPIAPFITEEIYKNLTNKESVHLEDYPTANEKLIDEKLNIEMKAIREIITEGLQLRAQKKIKVRQPLQKLIIKGNKLRKEFLDIIKEEVNVKEVRVSSEQQKDKRSSFKWNEKKIIGLDTEITEELKIEGQAREVIRIIQQMRKEAGYEVDNRIIIGYNCQSVVFEKFGKLIAKETLATEIMKGKLEKADLEKEVEIESQKIILSIKRS